MYSGRKLFGHVGHVPLLLLLRLFSHELLISCPEVRSSLTDRKASPTNVVAEHSDGSRAVQ